MPGKLTRRRARPSAGDESVASTSWNFNGPSTKSTTTRTYAGWLPTRTPTARCASAAAASTATAVSAPTTPSTATRLMAQRSHIGRTPPIARTGDGPAPGLRRRVDLQRSVGVDEFRLLGPLEVVVDGRPVSLGGEKPRALLAFLLLERNRAVPTERLVDALWGERPPPRRRRRCRCTSRSCARAWEPNGSSHARPGTSSVSPTASWTSTASSPSPHRRASCCGGRRTSGLRDAARGARPLARAGAARVPRRAVRRAGGRRARGAAARGTRRPPAGRPRQRRDGGGRPGARGARRRRSPA